MLACSLILKTDGSLYAFGENTGGLLGDGTHTHRSTPTQIISLGVAQIAAGGYFSLIWNQTVHSYSWGLNNAGQLGDGSLINRNTPQHRLYLRV